MSAKIPNKEMRSTMLGRLKHSFSNISKIFNIISGIILSPESAVGFSDRLAISDYLEDIDAYDNVFVCGPCWCGTFPMPVFSLLERLDFTGKKVMVLMTHEGSGLGNSERDLKKLCRGASFGNGMAVHGADSAKAEKAIAGWAKKNIGE